MCFNHRDKGKCRFGSECRFSHDPNLINSAMEKRASLNVFAADLATNESDQALMAANREVYVGADHVSDSFTPSNYVTYR